MHDDHVAVFISRRGTLGWIRQPTDGGVLPIITPNDDEPVVDAVRAVAAEAGLTGVNVRCTAGPFSLDTDSSNRVTHAVMVDADGATATVDTPEPVLWLSPQEARDRGVPEWVWLAYDRVAPTVRSIAADSEHGSSHLAIRALEVLRDRADALVASDESGEELVHLGRELRTIRPDMVALKVRVATALAEGSDPAIVLDRAHAGITDAYASSQAVAATAEAVLNTGRSVFVFSRSETVLSVVDSVEPASITTTVAMPGGEGIDLAERLADEYHVELAPDAAIATVLDESVDVVLVGADGIDADGSVINKVGTRTVATVAEATDVPVYVCSSVAKCGVNIGIKERLPASTIYDGTAPITVHSSMVDRTDSSLVTGYVTDHGLLDATDIGEIARSNAQLLDTTRP